MLIFILATALPYTLLFAATSFGGVWAWAAIFSMTIWIFALDRLTPRNVDNPNPDAEFPGSTDLLIVLGILHFVALIILADSFSAASNLSRLDKVLILITCGLMFGQISHPVAHELIHRPTRWIRILGQLMYSTNLAGHHASAHLRVHHIHVATDKDPNSAPKGESFYHFALRAAKGSFLAGLAAENKLRDGKNLPLWSHPYTLYTGTGIATLIFALLIGGFPGFLAVLIAGLHAYMQILLSDYVQHYGLRRTILPNGKPEPVTHRHSWNAAERYSAAVTLNAPRHSDHHVKPNRDYPALQLDSENMPRLPRSLPVMAMIAMVPGLWQAMMDQRSDKWC